MPVKLQREEACRDGANDHLYDHAASSWVEIRVCIGRQGNEADNEQNNSL